MEYRSRVLVSRELLQHSDITDEYIYRDLLRKMVSDLPFEELKKFILFFKIDPNTTEIRQKINDPETSDKERSDLIELSYRQLVRYEIEFMLR